MGKKKVGKKTKHTHTQIGRQEEEIKGRLLEKIEEINFSQDKRCYFCRDLPQIAIYLLLKTSLHFYICPKVQYFTPSLETQLPPPPLPILYNKTACLTLFQYKDSFS